MAATQAAHARTTGLLASILALKATHGVLAVLAQNTSWPSHKTPPHLEALEAMPRPYWFMEESPSTIAKPSKTN